MSKHNVPKRKNSRYVPGSNPSAQPDLMTRLPHWLADDAVDARADNPKNSTIANDPDEVEVCFPEEFLRREGDGLRRFIPFKPMIDGIDERDRSASVRMLIGEQFQDGGTEFDRYLMEVMQLIRNYNAALYWLRLCHLMARPTTKPVGDLPSIPSNKGFRDPSTIPDPATQGNQYRAALADAESDLAKSVCALRSKLQERTAAGDEVVMDAIRCNDYVISVRVVAGPDLDYNSAKAPEIGGSSSSYINISSPYSSSSFG